jgi:hypothetical protein
VKGNTKLRASQFLAFSTEVEVHVVMTAFQEKGRGMFPPARPGETPDRIVNQVALAFFRWLRLQPKGGRVARTVQPKTGEDPAAKVTCSPMCRARSGR